MPSKKVSSLRRMRLGRSNHAPVDGSEAGGMSDDENVFDVSDSDSNDDPIIPSVMNDPNTGLLEPNEAESVAPPLEFDGEGDDAAKSPSRINRQGLIHERMAYKSPKPDPTEIDGYSDHSTGTSQSFTLWKDGKISSPSSFDQKQNDAFLDDPMEPHFPEPVEPLSPGKRQRATLSSPNHMNSTPQSPVPPGLPKAMYDHEDDDDDETSGRDESGSSFQDEAMDAELSKLLHQDDGEQTECTPVDRMDATPRLMTPPGSASDHDNDTSERDDSNSSFQDELMDAGFSNMLDCAVEEQEATRDKTIPTRDLLPPGNGEDPSRGGKATAASSRSGSETDGDQSKSDNRGHPEPALSSEALDHLVEDLFTPEAAHSAPPPSSKTKRKKSKTSPEINPWENPWMNDNNDKASTRRDIPTDSETQVPAVGSNSPYAELVSENEMPSLGLFPSGGIPELSPPHWPPGQAGMAESSDTPTIDLETSYDNLSPLTPMSGRVAQKPTKPPHMLGDEETDQVSSNAGTKLYSAPPATRRKATAGNSTSLSPLKPPSPYSTSRNDDEGSDHSNERDRPEDPLNGDTVGRSNRFSDLKLFQPSESPIIITSADDASQCSDRISLTERFDDEEASMDFRALMGVSTDECNDDKEPELIPSPPDLFLDPPDLSPERFREDKDTVSDLDASEKSEHISRTTIALAAALACVLTFLAAIIGGILGAFVFGTRGETKEVIVFVTNPPVEQNATAPVATPTMTPTTVSPTANPTIPPTVTPTGLPTAMPLVTNQELFDIIAEASFDGGESIGMPGSPQQRAFAWIQNVDVLTNDQRRRLRRSERRSLALSPNRVIQRYAMAAIYYATNGEAWTRSAGWLDPQTGECDWISDSEVGSGCSASEKQVRTLQFGRNNLTGTLPPEVALLSSLGRLDIVGEPDGGHLKGRIPSEIRLLTNLRFLKIRGHHLDEVLPDNLFENMSLLTTLDLSLNKLPGRIPTSVTNLTSIEKIVLSDNAFSQEIPHDIAWGNLKHLGLQNNLLTGQLSPTLANLTLIESCDVSNNFLRGRLPDFSGWTMLREKLDFSHNNFTGPLLDSFHLLGDLKIVRASNNQLTGGIPSSLAALESLKEMDISGNGIEGNVTEEMCLTFEATNASLVVDCAKIVCGCCNGC